MNTFAQAVTAVEQEQGNLGSTANGAVTLRSSRDVFTDLFAMIGSARNAQGDAVALFKTCFAADPKMALRILFWARDARGGAGERSIFRICVNTLPAGTQLKLVQSGMIEELGRWDDYIPLMVGSNDRVARAAATRVLGAIKAGNGLAAKWCPRKGVEAAKIRKLFGMSPKMYRKTLVEGTKVVETQMCRKQWENITYEHVPSVAMARYTRAFARNSTVAFPAYKAKLESGEVKAKAQALFPYDVLRTLANGDAQVADAQWNELPNYIDGRAKLFPIVDVSGSMTTIVSGSVSAMDIAISLGLYISERQNSALKNLFMTFDTKPEIMTIPNGSLSEKVRFIHQAPWGGSTDLQAAFDLLLNTAVRHKVAAEDMPEYLFIVSDMEFNEATGKTRSYWNRNTVADTNYSEIERKYRQAGYKRPNIIFWNVNSRSNNIQVTADEHGTAMISGFSPSILRPLLNAEEISPRLIMEQAVMVDRYAVDGLTV